jgi:hypothetical protein
MIKITLQTHRGTATAETTTGWGTSGPILISGPGATSAREWLDVVPGAFGTFVEGHAAPEDLHCAAVHLQQNPRPEIQVILIEGDPAVYNSGIPADAIT